MADNYQITEGVGKTMRSREGGDSIHRAVFLVEPYIEGGLLAYRNIDLGVTGQMVKSSKGQIYTAHLFNQHATDIAYVKIYDKASAATHSDTPIYTIPLGAKGGAYMQWEKGIAFLLGISLRGTTGIADSDTGAPATNQVVVNFGYF